MAGFNAGRAVKALDYDFTAFEDGVKGTIPEPSPDEFRDFREAMSATLPSTDPEVLKDLGTDDIRRIDEEGLDAVAALCKGSPTREQIAALPARVQSAFIAWLLGSFVDPTGSAGTRR